jgi:hypothetical protein
MVHTNGIRVHYPDSQESTLWRSEGLFHCGRCSHSSQSSTAIQVVQLYTYKLCSVLWASQSHTARCEAPPCPDMPIADGEGSKQVDRDGDDKGEAHPKPQRGHLTNILMVGDAGVSLHLGDSPQESEDNRDDGRSHSSLANPPSGGVTGTHSREDINMSQPQHTFPRPPAPATGITPSLGRRVHVGVPEKRWKLLPRPYVLVPVSFCSLCMAPGTHFCHTLRSGQFGPHLPHLTQSEF